MREFGIDATIALDDAGTQLMNLTDFLDEYLSANQNLERYVSGRLIVE